MSEDEPAIVTELPFEAICVIRFNRPSQRNPLSLQTLQDLKLVLDSLATRNDVNAIVFTGTEDVFASGANIRELETLQPASALAFSRLGQQLFQLIENARQVTIAAINGFCMGGALDLALACDIRVATPDAAFAHPGAKLGIITGWGGTQRLPRLVRKNTALELLLTARRFTANDALQLGLVTNLSEDVVTAALTIAKSATKHCVRPSGQCY